MKTFEEKLISVIDDFMYTALTVTEMENYNHGWTIRQITQSYRCGYEICKEDADVIEELYKTIETE